MYTIQVGRNKGSYKTRWTTTNSAQAGLLYKGINIGNGYKKRLLLNGKMLTCARS